MNRVRRQRWGLWLAGVLLVAALLGTTAAARFVWDLQSSQADRLLVLSDVFAGATVVLAGIAGVIALAAYAAATQRPNLEVGIQFRFSRPNVPVLQVNPADQFGMRYLAPWRQCEAQVLVHNKSSYSARNPAVRIDLRGLGGGLGGSPGWTPIHFVNTVGPTGAQWEGGADYAIHGNWTRELPMLDFAGVAAYGNEGAKLLIEIVADGFRGNSEIPVVLLEGDQYQKYSTSKAEEDRAAPADSKPVS